MPRFATFALFAALLASPAALWAQNAEPDENGDRVGPAAENRVEGLKAAEPAAKEREERADRKQAPGVGPGGRPAPRPPGTPPAIAPVVTPLPELIFASNTADARVAPFGEGFATYDGTRFVGYDKDGKNEVEVYNPGQKVDRWWLSADGKRVMWVSGKILWTALPGTKEMDELGEAPIGAPAISPDGKQVAFTRGGKLVVRTLGGKEERSIAPATDLILGDAAAWSIDGKKVFALVGNAANEPDGIGAADLTGDAPAVARVYQATNAILSQLTLSPNGKWLVFVQTGKADARQSALRLLAPDGSEFRTLARSTSISDITFAADGQRTYFSARGANGLWGAWEAGLEPDGATGEIPVRRIVEEEGKQFLKPVIGRDGVTGYFIREDAEGKDAKVGRVKIR